MLNIVTLIVLAFAFGMVLNSPMKVLLKIAIESIIVTLIYFQYIRSHLKAYLKARRRKTKKANRKIKKNEIPTVMTLGELRTIINNQRKQEHPSVASDKNKDSSINKTLEKEGDKKETAPKSVEPVNVSQTETEPKQESKQSEVPIEGKKTKQAQPEETLTKSEEIKQEKQEKSDEKTVVQSVSNANKDLPSEQNTKSFKMVEKAFGSPELNTLFSQYVYKYEKVWNEDSFKAVMGIARILDENAKLPSVVDNVKKKQPKDKQSKILSYITILEHSVDVANLMMKSLKHGEEIGEYQIPRFLITALGHDIGKIKGHELVHEGKNFYSSSDHIVYGASMLNSIEGFKNLSFKEAVLTAINNHHRIKDKDVFAPVNVNKLDPLSRALVEADRTARQNEQIRFMPRLEQYQKKAKSKDFLEWVDKNAILNEIKANINVVSGNGRWQVISMPDGNVYVHFDFIKTALRNEANRKGKKDVIAMININNDELNKKILAKTVILLKENINEYLMAGWKIGRKFTVSIKINEDSNDMRKLSLWFIPFKLDSFGLIAGELEKDKPAILKKVKKISIAAN